MKTAFCLGVSLLCLGLAASAGEKGANLPEKLKKSKPIVCGGDADKVVSRVHIVTESDAVVVKGDCDLVLKDCRIEAGRYGVVTKSNADVQITNCHITGKKAAVFVGGNGDVYAKRSTFVGPIRTAAITGDFHKGKHNKFEKIEDDPKKKDSK